MAIKYLSTVAKDQLKVPVVGSAADERFYIDFRGLIYPPISKMKTVSLLVVDGARLGDLSTGST